MAEFIYDAPKVKVFLPTGGAVSKTLLLESQHVFGMFVIDLIHRVMVQAFSGNIFVVRFEWR